MTRVEPSETRKKSYTAPSFRTLDPRSAAAELQAKRLPGDKNGQKLLSLISKRMRRLRSTNRAILTAEAEQQRGASSNMVLWTLRLGLILVLAAVPSSVLWLFADARQALTRVPPLWRGAWCILGRILSQKPAFRFISLLSVPHIISLWVLVSALTAQVAEHQTRVGFPQDWTHRHVVFHRQTLWQHPQLTSEPRVLHQFIRKMAYSAVGPFAASDEVSPKRTAALRRDWSVNLGVGKVAFGMSPVKYGFDVNALPSCANDFAAFGLDVAGVTGGQANLVAFNNLYRGPGGLCGTGAPSILFSYNTTTVAGGSILTSPILSLDGTKIAFVESAGGSSIFHVLKWATGPGNGTSPINSAAPGVGNTATMTSLTYAATATNNHSSPWIDYGQDVAYVGADDGRLYKITGVFNGAPTLAGAPWPVLINANRRLTAPVLDQVTRNIF